VVRREAGLSPASRFKWRYQGAGRRQCGHAIGFADRVAHEFASR